MPKLLLLLFVVMMLAGQTGQAHAARPKIVIPPDFPAFVVPGQDRLMAELRELFWTHYERGGPLATLWDEWESGPTLWPAVTTDDRMSTIRDRWRAALLGRDMDDEGYVATHQHGSIAHQQGWPFPFWMQGRHGWGWHFSLHNVPEGWHGTEPRDQTGWTVEGVRDLGVDDAAWSLELAAPDAAVTTPEMDVHPDDAPFIQIRWAGENLGSAQPYVQWATREHPDFSRERMMHFAPAGAAAPSQWALRHAPASSRDLQQAVPPAFTYTMIPVYKHPAWTGDITRLRICFGNPAPGGKVALQAVFTNYDTRHTINNQNFIRGSAIYFRWTGDVNFLRDNIQRVRLAMRYLMTELGGLEEKCIVVPWVGHDGRPGFTVKDDGTKEIHTGRGIGNNYWDLLPMGYRDAYATIQYYSALNELADLERDIERHPEWSIPGGPLRLAPDDLTRHAREVKAHASELFWNKETRRFTTGPDIDGRIYDYGFVFLNLEAIHYDFATPRQARDILTWITGKRTVRGDTSQGDDIYHWRFGPRSTTRRNVEYYFWAWSAPESIPWGGQVQDGGAVLGFSYHDLMSRLKWLGPDDCWQRLQQIAAWYSEVQDAGGPREYYKDGTRGTLQGGGTAGGLGVDMEFFESILVPQIITDGFLGLRPLADGLSLDPRLPKGWPSLAVTGIHWHDLVFDIEATDRRIGLTCRECRDTDTRIVLPAGDWTANAWDREGRSLGRLRPRAAGDTSAFQLDWKDIARVAFHKRVRPDGVGKTPAGDD
ncbi:MAG: hypothetical protein JSV65_13950 [Armatimonadota bacterium]|nr:MAG: hypothetical protein JSV65_13950 [Armatimonadota bacterium]